MYYFDQHQFSAEQCSSERAKRTNGTNGLRFHPNDTVTVYRSTSVGTHRDVKEGILQKARRLITPTTTTTTPHPPLADRAAREPKNHRCFDDAAPHKSIVTSSLLIRALLVPRRSDSWDELECARRHPLVRSLRKFKPSRGFSCFFFNPFSTS